jgi:hypothetical protein
MTAYPDSGWYFDGWSGDLTGMANPDTLLMDSNKSVTVTFTEIPKYSLSVNIVGNGVVTVNGSSPYAAGSVVVMTAYPDSGWYFDGWSGDLTGMANPDTLLMDSNKSVTVTFTEIPKIIESCDSTGVQKDTFSVGENVYVNGTGFGNAALYSLYVVEDQAVWNNGMAIPSRIPGTATTIMSLPNGMIAPTLSWAAPLVPGKYDIVVDVNNNTQYDVGIDTLDDNDIEVTAGFFVIPEVAIGSVMAIASMFTALVGYVGLKHHRTK